MLPPWFVMAEFTVNAAPSMVRACDAPDLKLSDATVHATSFVIAFWLLLLKITAFGP